MIITVNGRKDFSAEDWLLNWNSMRNAQGSLFLYKFVINLLSDCCVKNFIMLIIKTELTGIYFEKRILLGNT